jgi:hypothetical protein
MDRFLFRKPSEHTVRAYAHVCARVGGDMLELMYSRIRLCDSYQNSKHANCTRFYDRNHYCVY